MSTTIESLELEILSNSESAAQGIEALTESLNKLRSATKGSSGLNPLSNDLEKVNNTLKKVQNTNKNTAKSFTDVYHQLKSVGNSLVRVGEKIMTVVEKSMDYTENINLFTVSMGEYATKAYTYAEKVSAALGIDTSEWIRAQGVFMTLASGFGVASDRAYTMSKNLTQLSYDLASFYNMDIEDTMAKVKSGLAGELEPLRAIGYDLSQAKLEEIALKKGITKSVSAMTQAEKAQLRYYAIMTQVTDTHGDMARTLEDPANQMRVFKAQVNMAAREIGNMFIPALNAIIPYATAVAQTIGSIASTLATLFGFKKKEVEDTTKNASDNTQTITQNLSDATDQAKKLKSYMLGFDELNVINPNAGEEDASGWKDFDLPDYENKFLEGLAESRVAGIVEKMKEWLGFSKEIKSWSDLIHTRFFNILVLAGLIGVAIASWKFAKGVSLVWTNLPKIISNLVALTPILKAFGVAAVTAMAAVGAIWLINNTDSTIEKIGAIISGAALVVGAILAFTGINLPLGIGLMAVGAISMGSAIAMNTDKLSDDVKGVIAIITTVVSGALLALGAVLAFTGVNIPLGIALMLGGALTLATVIAPNWNKLSDSVKNSIFDVMGVIGSALLVVGGVLAFSGINLPLGIALMAMGAVSLGTAIALNWDTVSNALQSPVGGITALISGALLALGAILAFSGVGLPLGIALMVVGAASLATVAALNWNTITDALKGTIGIITALVSGALLVLGIILCCTGVGIPLGIALIAAGAAGLATVVALNWNAVKDGIKTMFASVLAIISGAMLVLGVLMLLNPATIGLGISLIFGALKLSNTASNIDDNPVTRFVKKMANGILNIVNWAIDGINKIGDIKFPGLSIAGVEIIPAFNHKLWNIPKIPLMAEGGFPEQGQMFIAREAGAEMVGNIGRRTAVVNNDQIVASISGGVASANEEQNELLREQNSLLRAILEKDSGVYLDGKNLTNSVEKYQRERGRNLIVGGVL